MVDLMAKLWVALLVALLAAMLDVWMVGLKEKIRVD
jgi:hypothetical protein